MVQEEGGAVRKSVSWSDLQRQIRENCNNPERPSHSLDMELERKKHKKSAYHPKASSSKKISPNSSKKRNGNRLSTSGIV